MKRAFIILVFSAFAALSAMAMSTAAAWPSDGPEGIQASAATASAFELQMRILEGSRETPAAANRPVTSSYLEFVTFSNFEDESNVALDAEIKKVFSLKDVSLLTEANLVWEKGKAGQAFHMFRINGQEYMVLVTPGRLPERNHFHIQVFEQAAAAKSDLLDTEFSLPDKKAAVFGFEDSASKSYFITLRVERWSGEPAAASGGVVGGVVPGVLKSGAKVMPPKLVKQVDPVYPEIARRARVEGAVILEATTDTYGRVASVKVLRGIPLLDQSAIDALRQWVYEPMVVDGKPRPVTFTVTMQFRLNEKKPEVSGVIGGVVGGVQGGIEGGVEGGVVGGVLGGAAGEQARKEFEKGALRAVGDVKPPRLVKYVEPVYPPEARKAGVEGVIILEARADEKGDVLNARVLRSIPALDQAAIDAVKQWKYEPLVIDGKPRPVVFTVTVRFELKEKGQSQALEKFAAGAVKAEGEIKPPKLLKEVVPVYPKEARAAEAQGVVILGVRTDETGKVADALVLRSIPLLDQAAIDAVKQWVYEPFILDGQPRPCVFTVTVRFQLK
jgi:TonB family protein